MSVAISCRELLKIFECTPAEQNIMLTGKHGIGKSRIIEKYFKDRGYKVVILFLGQMSDPGDLIGLPRLNEKTGRTDFIPPYWFPSDDKPVVLFLDELNRARPEVLQTVMDLVLSRTLAGRRLPEGSRVVSAVNEGDEYQLTDLDPALVSRFNIYEFRPTVPEWLVWAAENGIDGRVADFITQNYDMLDGESLKREDSGLDKTPDRRAWENVSSIIKPIKEFDDSVKKIIAGIVGYAAAAKFVSFVSADKFISAEDVLCRDFSKIFEKLLKLSTPEFAVVNESIFRYIEVRYGGADGIGEIKAANLVRYFDFFSDNGFREAQAHFVNLYSSSSYPKTVVFIVTYCPDLYKKINRFIKSL